MAKIKVYDKDDVLHLKEPVDARECVDELGWSMTITKNAIVDTATVKPARKPRSPNKPKVTDSES